MNANEIEEERLRFTSLLCREICSGLKLASRPTLSAVALVRKSFKALQKVKGDDDMDCARLAMVCVLLGTKLEESLESINRICRTCSDIEAVRNLEKFKDVPIDERIKQVKVAEMVVLSSMGFIVPSSLLPHRFIVWLVEVVVPVQLQRELIVVAWGYLNDAMILDLEREDPMDVACAALLLAGFELQVELPSHPMPWLQAVGAHVDAVERIANDLSDLVFEWKPKRWMI